jgi:hypothetical protein
VPRSAITSIRIDPARSRLRSCFHRRDHRRSKPWVQVRSLGGHAFIEHRWRFDARALEDVSALDPEGKRLREQCDDRPLVGYRILKQLTPFFEMICRRRATEFWS